MVFHKTNVITLFLVLLVRSCYEASAENEATPKHLNVSLINELKRSVRVTSKVPSRSFVEQIVQPSGSANVQIKFENNVDEVELIAMDEETYTPVALNLNKSLTLKTSTDPYLVTRVKISPFVFSVLPQYSFNFVQNGSFVLGYPLLRKHTPLLAAFTQRYNGLRFFRANYVDGKLPATKSCLVTPEFCDKGLTIGFKIRIPNIEGYFEYKQYIFETEAVTVYFHLKNLVVLLRTTAPSKEWKISTKELEYDEWMYVVYTWQQQKGAQLYINSKKLQNDRNGRIINPRTETEANNKQNHQRLVVGSSLDGKSGLVKNFHFASLTILHKHLNKDETDQMMIYFWNNELAQMYWALIYIYNSEPTSVTLQSEEYQIELRPNAQVSTVIRSLTSNGHPPDALNFHAKNINEAYTPVSGKDVFVVKLEKYVARKYQMIIGNHWKKG